MNVARIKNQLNPADLLTKPLSMDEMSHIFEYLEHVPAEGRNDSAPELALVVENHLEHILDIGEIGGLW